MAVLKLRNHIPIASPARREPADGTETDMRVSLGFEPMWYSKRCNVEFSEKWHKDPYYRHETLKVMKEELVKRFPTVSYWDTSKTEDLATISGCYGAYVIPRVFGIPLLYYPDRWPELDPTKKLSIEDIEKLDPDKLLEGPFVEELFSQMDTIEKEWGKIHGYLNWQGVLNNAIHIHGENVFLEFYDKPDFIKHFFSIITEVMIRLAKAVQKRQRESGFYINQFSVSNCTLNMIAPEVYEEFILPLDTEIAENFERFGVHTCNWNVTPYIDVLRRLPKVGYIDMGMMSDMVRVKEVFPDARRAVMYSPNTLHVADINTIKRDMETIFNAIAPCDLVMADITWDTSDERVNELLTICRNLEEGKS